MEGPARGGLRLRDAFAIAALACPLGSADALVQQYDESLLSALEWTNIGPPRFATAGRWVRARFAGRGGQRFLDLEVLGVFDRRKDIGVGAGVILRCYGWWPVENHQTADRRGTTGQIRRFFDHPNPSGKR